MFEKFTQDNKAENIRRWLQEGVDLNSADILQTEREIYTALVRAQRPTRWYSTPIAPLAEPVDMDALVGDLFNNAQQELRYQTSRTDNIYSWLSELNNVIKSELDTVEKNVVQATDDVQDISLVVGDESRNFHWVSDSFNNSSFTDAAKTTALVDTDYGMITLSPANYELISDFNAIMDRSQTNGIPGCSLLVINSGKRAENQEPQPLLEGTNTREFGSIFDGDANTWFEIERNFIPPRQKLKFTGRAWETSEAGQEQDVLQVTKDLDWKAKIEWPDAIEAGADGNGVYLTEFRNLDSELASISNSSANLSFDIILKTPQPFSAIRLLPFIRESESITVKSVRVLIGDTWIDVAKDTILGSNKSTTKLQREIYRRTGVQTTGSIFAIPTNRDISRIRVELNSPPVSVRYGLAHAFLDVLTEERTERNHLLWNSVDTWQEWRRHPVNKDIPTISLTNNTPKLLGTIKGAASTIQLLGTVWASLPTNSIGAATIAGKAIAGTIGQLGAWLGKALPIVGAILALDQIVGGFFKVEHSSTVKEARVGFDVFKGWRSAIGLRDFSIIRTTYGSEAVVQSVKREFPGLVSKIGLFVDEYIPESWGPGDWITYYVSTDGSNWTLMPKLSDTTLDKSLTLTEPTRFIFFKAVIKGNPTDNLHSPALRHYALMGLPV